MSREAEFAANRAVRAYNGPHKLPDGSPHPEWARLLRVAHEARLGVAIASPVNCCPACGYRFYRT